MFYLFKNIILIIIVFGIFRYILFKKQEYLKYKNSIFLCVLNIALLSHAYLEPGWLITGDSNAHVARIAHLYKAHKENISLHWSNYFYGGSPVLAFYSPLFFYVSEFFVHYFNDLYWGIKITLFISNILSGLGMLFFLKSINFSQIVAIISALIYAGSFAHIHLILLRGMFPLSFIFMLLPWLFYLGKNTIDSLNKNKKIDYTFLFLTSIILTGMLISHIISGLYAFFLLSIFLLYQKKNNHYKKILSSLFLIGIISTLLSIDKILPVIIEKADLVMATIPLAVSFKIPSFQELIFLTAFRKGQQGSNSITFLGYMPIILSLIGIIYHIYLKKYYNIFITTLLLTICFCVKATYAREGVFILFFITILSAYGLKVILTFKKPWISKIIIGFVCIELLLGSIYPLSRTDKKFYQDIAQYIQKEFSNQRIVTIHKTQNKYQVPIGPNGGILGQFDIQKLNGPHNLTVPITHNYNVTLLKKVEMDLNTAKQVSKKTKRLLCAYNVAALVFIDERTQEFNILKTDCATPVLFVTNITASEKEHAKSDYPAIWHEDTRKAKNVAQALQFLSEFENNIDPKITSLKSISIRNLLYQNTFNIEKKIKTTPLSQIKYQVKRDRIFLKCYAHQDGFIRLSHPVYKGLEIELNGTKAIPLQDDLGMMLLPVTKGDIEINIYATKSSLRRNLSILSNFLLFIMAIYLSITYINKYKKYIRILLRKIYFKIMKLYQKAFS